MYILLKRKRAELLISPLEFFFYQVLVVVVYLKSLITVEPVLRSTVLCDQPELRLVAKVISFFLFNHYNFCFIKQSPLLSGRSQALLSLEGLFVFSSTCTERSLKAESLNWD